MAVSPWLHAHVCNDCQLLHHSGATTEHLRTPTGEKQFHQSATGDVLEILRQSKYHISRPRPDEWCRSSPISFGPVLLSPHHKRLRGHKQQYRGRYLLLSKPRHAGLYVSGRFGEHSLQSGLRTNVSSSAFAISSRFELKPGEELSFEAILLEC
uniref:Uncharacterized protein n=1 Tax=Cacopsylla melanoneura TaxID=428564 RepID=A0A8D9E3H8_9HEMI